MQIAKIAFFTIFIYLLILLWFIYYNKIEINLYGDEFTDDSQKNNFSKKINQTSIFKGPVLDVQKEYLKKREASLLKNLDIRLDINSYDKLNEYVMFFNKNLKNTKNGTKKVMFCDPKSNGYGNRLYTFISCILVGILSDSLVILTAWNESRNFLELPFNPFYVTKENNYLNPNFDKKKIHRFRVPYAWKAKKDINVLMKFEIPKDRTRYFYGTCDCLFMVVCTNPIYYKKLIYYNLVKNETVQESIQTMKNKSSTVKEKKHNLFRIGFEVGANLLNKIVIPKPKIQEVVKEYVKKYFVENYVIGIQLRKYYLDVEKDSVRFINCAFQIENEYLRAYKEKAKPVKWFISTDSEELLNKIVSLYPDKTLIGKGSIVHVGSNSHGYERVLIDIDLLSKCDEMIHTGGSTFGFVAAMKSFKVPYFVDGRKSELKCFRTFLGTSSATSKGVYVF